MSVTRGSIPTSVSVARESSTVSLYRVDQPVTRRHGRGAAVLHVSVVVQSSRFSVSLSGQTMFLSTYSTDTLT